MSFIVQKAGNQAIDVNRVSGVDYHLTTNGSDWLWAVASIFGLLTVVYAALFFAAEYKGSALTRYALAVPFLISFFEFFFYFTYASNLGWTAIQAEFGHVTVDDPVTTASPGYRQIFYSKFVAWFLSWPLLLFLLELAGSSTTVPASELETLSVFDMVHSLLIQIFSAFFWVVSLLVGSLIRSSYKWGYWTFGAVTMLIGEAVIIRRHVFTLKLRGFSLGMLCTASVIVWLYFVCWGLSEGGNVIQPNSEAVFYGILDLCIFAIYPAYLLFIVARFGRWPSFSLRGGFGKDYHDTHTEKTSDPNSIRESGDTHVVGAVPGVVSATGPDTHPSTVSPSANTTTARAATNPHPTATATAEEV
ncbi:hypothetical protein HG535_0F00750 [Zygotorulaspora mrakii]|uniref:30 kDa heat shock protein n=1 Tax=Zygotorulaspora mrakii TaxID=42260 RepID=A0A7H9B4F8_ZYGMR|nr:uncharacterized protein HG535_0F00750 [Zygotorulaspora mrakii]QLG73565.1 hypothetical protein HG535_0F00750 [Zygotorulaspora mrakii]